MSKASGAPADVQVIGDTLAIRWQDGCETYLSGEPLRRACPCAGCAGEPDATGHVIKPQQFYTERSFQLDGFAFVGGYALQPVWADGHRTGLYSWAYLRELEGRLADGGCEGSPQGRTEGS